MGLFILVGGLAPADIGENEVMGQIRGRDGMRGLEKESRI